MLGTWLRRKPRPAAHRLAPHAEWLEPRLLYSADAGALLVAGTGTVAPEVRVLTPSLEYALPQAFALAMPGSNTAPVLSGANAGPTVYEDFKLSGGVPPGPVPPWTNPAQRQGALVSDLISGQVTDTAGSLSGIAITATTGNGSWQYSTDGGNTWTSIGGASTTSAVLLAADSQTRLRFVPAADFNSAIGTTAVTFRAWDGTTGSNGGVADTSVNGGSSAYSTATATSVFTVVPVNDAPVAVGTPTATSVAEGASASTLGLAGVSYLPGPATATDEATQSLTVTVTAIPTDLVQVYLADGVTPVTVGSTYTIDQLQGMVYGSAPGAIPGSGTFSFAVQDSGGTDNGGSDTLVQNLTLTVTNVAPVLGGANAMPSLLEDTTDNGTLVADLVAGRITDPGGMAGIAVTATDNTHGTWQYSTDGGSTWTAFGATSASAARLLCADTLTRVRFVPNADWNGTTTFGFVAWDRSSGTAGATADASLGGGTSAFSSASATASLSVTPVNDAPVLSAGTLADLTVAEDSGGTSLGLGTVAYAPGGGSDEASQGLTYTVTALPPASLGRVTLADGTAVAAGDYTLAQLRGMRFVTATDAVGTGTFGFQVHDSGGTANGGSDTLVQSLQINVTAVNDPPVRTAGIVANLTVAEDSGSSSLGLGSIAYAPGGGADEAGQTLAYSVTTLPPASLGTIVLADGTPVTTGSYTLAQIQGMRFQAAADANGTAAFAFAVQDNGGGTDTLVQSLKITVTPVNDPPLRTAGAVADLTVAEDSGTTSLGLGSVDYGPGGGADEASQTLTYTITALPPTTLGAIQLADGTAVVAGHGYTLTELRGMQFTGALNANGSGTLRWTVADSAGGTLTQSMGITVTPVNDAPVADAGTTTVGRGGTVSASVSATDVDLPADTLTVSLVSGPTHGTLTLNADGTYSYTHDGTAFYTDSFTWQVTDAAGASSQASVDITITPTANNAPSAQPGTATLAEGGTVSGAVVVTDPDLPADTLTLTVVSGPAHGTLTFNADGSYTYTHDGSENFADVFTYKVTDANGASSQASVSFTITPVNDNAPVAQAGSNTVAEGGTVTGAVAATDADLPNDSLVYGLVSAPAHGTLTFNGDGTYTYTHDGTENFSDTFTYEVKDANGARSQASVTLTVTPVNDNTPVAQAGSGTVAEGGTLSGVVTATDTDLPNDSLAFSVVNGPAHGTLTFNADGSYSYTHDGTENFSDVFTYQVTDANGATSQASVSLTITPVNDNAPVAQSTTVTLPEGGSVADSVTIGDADLPNDSLTVQLVTGPAHGTLSLAADGSFSYTHDGSENFSDSFTYQVTDANGASSQGTIGFTISPVDDPSVLAVDVAVVPEDAPATGNVLANDTDVDSALQVAGFQVGGGSYAAGSTVTLANVGTFSLGADGNFRFTPMADWNGSAPQVTYTTNTGASSTLAITVTPVDDAPVLTSAAPADAAVPEGSGPTSLGLSGVGYGPGGGADEAGEALSFTVTALPAGIGRVVLADGSTDVLVGGHYTLADLQGMQFIPAAGVDHGSGTFAFTVGDDASTTATLPQSLTVSVTNRAPLLGGANALPALPEDSTDSGMLVSDLIAGQASDPSGRLGIAVVGAQGTGGLWEYSRDGGATWSAFGATSNGSAVLLPADAVTRVRFVPAADWNGTASGLTFRAWDQSNGTAGLQRADTTINGGASAFSSTVASTSITVQAVNDAPVQLTAGASNVSVTESAGASSLQLQGFSYAPGGGADEAGQALGVTITQLPAASVGTVVLADGVTPAVAGASYTVAQFQGLKFIPAARSAGSAGTLAWSVQDDGGTALGGIDRIAGAIHIGVAAPTVVDAGLPAAPPPVVAPAPGVPGTPVVVAPQPGPVTPTAATPAPRPAGSTPVDPLGGPADSAMWSGPSGFSPQGLQVVTDVGRTEVLRGIDARDVLLASLQTVLDGEFQVTGFAGLRGVPSISVDDFQQALRSGAFIDELDRMRRELTQQFDLDRTTSITVAGLSLGVSVVYVLWLIRGGVLLGSWLSALPAWRLLDPLPVLARPGEEDDDEDDALDAAPGAGPDPLRGFA